MFYLDVNHIHLIKLCVNQVGIWFGAVASPRFPVQRHRNPCDSMFLHRNLSPDIGRGAVDVCIKVSGIIEIVIC